MPEAVTHVLNISGPSGAQTYDIPAGITTLGRQAGVEIVLDDQLVSRRHAQIECTEAGCTITDLKSSNGTKVNGVRLQPDDPMTLHPGDVIEVGAFALTYEQVVTAPEPEPIAEPPAPPEPTPEPPEPEPALPPIRVTALSEQAAPEEQAAPPESEAPPKQESRRKPKAQAKEKAEEPPPPAVPPPAITEPEEEPEPAYTPPPGLSVTESRYVQYLPGIYHTSFMKRFLALFESIYAPIEWNVDNFDLYLSPGTVPAGFLPWLANWFDLTFDHSWGEAQRRALLEEAHLIYARRGTRWALSRVLEIYTGHKPEIEDTGEDLDPFTFTVTIPVAKSEINATLIEQLINTHKPAYTTYALHFAG